MNRQTVLNYTPEEEKYIKMYLTGKIGSRVLGTHIGLSHQGAINASCSYCRQALLEGKLRFK